ncbi:MAG: tetratricopeptide repeat protein [Planctomycetota bacterium]|nr:tetratricopeptide repeat protein [Planctomycetota bacterium]
MDFSKHIKKADEAFKRRNYDFAVELYRQLIELDPDQGEARSGLRRALKKRHEEKKGGKLLAAVSGAVPLGRAKTLRKLGKHDACARALESFLNTNPLHAGAHLMLGMALEEAGHFNSARAVYEFVTEIAPKNPEGLKRAGAMMQRTGDPARALEYYERALEADPRDQEALKARKNLAAETALGSTSLESVQHSRETIKDKDEAQELERARRRHLSEDELQSQLARLEERYAETPSDPDLMQQMAAVHERLGDPEAALDLVERALDYRKDSFELRGRQGDLRSKILKKKIAQADKDADQQAAGSLETELLEHEVADYRSRVGLRPGDATLRLQYARRLMRAGENDGALAELQKCNNDPRVRKDALFYLAQCFHRQGILDLAHKQYEKALEAVGGMNERAKEILYSLGSIAETQGSGEEARSFYTRIYEVDIGYRDVAGKMKQLN